jgi:peptidase E
VDRHIVAIGGGGFGEAGELTGIEREIASLARRADGRLRVCYLPNAGGDQIYSIERFHETWEELDAERSVLTLFRREVDDITAHLRGQDLIFVGGGSAANLMALWHLHGVPGRCAPPTARASSSPASRRAGSAGTPTASPPPSRGASRPWSTASA